MDIGVYSITEVSDEVIERALDEKRSFVLEGISVTYFSEAIETIEKLIESRGMSCRVYTKGRIASVAAAVIPTPVTVISGLASAVSIGAHNLATWNPDYEIAKNMATGTLTITYKK